MFMTTGTEFGDDLTMIVHHGWYLAQLPMASMMTGRDKEGVSIPEAFGIDLFGCTGDLEPPFFVFLGEFPMIADVRRVVGKVMLCQGRAAWLEYDDE